MKYLCTIYGDESQYADATPEQMNEMLAAYGAFGEEAGDAILGGEGLQPTSTATTVRVRDGERMLTDGPVRRDEGAARRLLPARVQQPRRGDRLGGQDPGSPVRLGRGAAGHELRGQRGRGRAAIGGGSQLAAPGAVVDRLFRRESGRAVATLIRILGDFDRAEEAVQEAFATAVERWPRDGVPANPGGWIVLTARNSAIDRLRRERATRRSCASWRRWAAARSQRTPWARSPTTGCGCSSRAATPPSRPRRAWRSRCARSAGSPPARSRAPSSPARRRCSSGSCAPSARSGRPAFRYEVPGGPPPARAAALGAGLALPDLQRGLPRHERRRARAPRAVRRGDPARPSARRAHARRARGARAARADAPEPLASRRARGRTRRHGAARGPGPLALAARRARGRPRARGQAGERGEYGLQAAIAAEHARARRADATDWRRIALLYERLAALKPLRGRGAEPRGGGGDGRWTARAACGCSTSSTRAASSPTTTCSTRPAPGCWPGSGATPRRPTAYARALELATNPVERRFLERQLAAHADRAADQR